MSNQPIWSSATIVTIVTAAIALLVAFGFELTNEQTAAILGFVGVLAPIAVAAFSNPRTTALAQPEDKDGTPLVREDTRGPTIVQMRSQEKKGG